MSGQTPQLRLAVTGHAAQWLLLLAWGVLAGLSFPRPNLHVLAHVALVPLVVLALKAWPVWRVGLYAWLGGALWWAVMVWWIGLVTGPGLIALALYLGLYVGAFVLLLRRVHEQRRLPLTLTVPLLWVALEYLRGTWMLTGFPWFLLGQSQPTVAIQIADAVGAYGVSFLVAMTNGLLADLILRPLREAAPRTGLRWSAPVRLWLPAWGLLVGLSLLYGTWRLGEAPAGGPGLRVAVVQSNVPQDNKLAPTPEQEEADFRTLLELSRTAAAERPDLIVWPETMVPRPLNEEAIRMFGRFGLTEWQSYRQRLERLVEETGVPMLLGAHAYEAWAPQPEGGYRPRDRYNAAYLLTERGIADRYDKVHRVPFGEYIPWVDRWPALKSLMIRYLTPYDHDYSLTPGERWTRFQVADGAGEVWHLAAPICFEDVVSRVPRLMVHETGAKRVDLLVNLSNDGWFAGTAQAPQHEQIARFRCVENRVPMARAVNTGVSSLIDSSGRIVERVEVERRTQQVAGVALAELPRDGRTSLFGRIGDALALAALVASVLLLAPGREGRRRGRAAAGGAGRDTAVDKVPAGR